MNIDEIKKGFEEDKKFKQKMLMELEQLNERFSNIIKILEESCLDA